MAKQFYVTLNQTLYKDTNTGMPLVVTVPTGYDNPIIVATDAEMAAVMVEANVGKFVKYVGLKGTYVPGAVYEVVSDENADPTQYYTLPDLVTPAEPSDVLIGKEAITADGELIVGEYVPYVLPALTSPAKAEEVLLGKEFINGNGEVGVGTYVQPEPAEDLDAELNEQDELLSDIEAKINEMANLEPEGTPNLVYTLSADGTYYIVGTGFTSIEAIEADASGGNTGSGLDENWRGGRVVIPRLHNGKPVLAIAPRAFLDILNITSVYIFDGITHIGHRCFQCTGNYGYDVAMNAIRFPNTLKKLGCGNGRVLWGRQGLTSVTLPNGVAELDNSTVAYCTGLDCLSAPMVTYAANSPMQNSPNITKVYLPNLEESVSNLCRDCESLTSIHLPKIKTLGSSAFSGCIALQTIRLGADLESIEAYAFKCGSSDNKTTIIIEATTPPTLSSGAFDATTYLATIAKIVVPKGCGNAYKTATNWTLVASLIEEAV